MTTPIGTARQRELLNNAPLLMLLLLILDSLHFVFARLLLPYLSPFTSSFYVLAVATVELAIFAAVRHQLKWQILKKNLRFFLIVGFLVAVATLSTFAAVAYMDPGTASLVARTYTIFSLALGILWLKERLWPMAWAGAAIAIIGVFVISYQSNGAGDLLRLGVLLVLFANVAYATHTAVVKRYGDDIEFTNFFLFRLGATTFFLLLFALGSQKLVWPNGPAWLLLLLVGTVNIIISRGLYYLALRRLPLSLHTILLTLSPVATILWSLALFDERPSTQGLLGGTAVIIGVLIVTVSRKTKSVGENKAQKSNETHPKGKG